MDLEQKVKSYLERIKKEDKKINAFLHLNENVLREAKAIDKKQKKGKLYQHIIAVKSNIQVKGLICNCASRTLENYRAPYNATVIEKIKAEDGLIVGMTNMDEFAAGSSGENSAFGPTQNPTAPGRIPGGSSSGSAAAVAASFCNSALGSDTGGSVRNPASQCGIMGYKPSYGLVSRYGLIDLSMSLDQIGILAKNLADITLLLSVIQGKDKRDTTTFEAPPLEETNTNAITLGILSIKGTNKKIQEHITKKIESLTKKHNWKTKNVTIKHIDLAVQTYYLLVYAEFFSATRRFDGRRYGKKIEDVAGQEVLRRILGGSETTRAEFEGAYYEKARAVKQIIKKEFENLFKDVDCIALPTLPLLPWKIGEGNVMKAEEIYAADALTIPVNLAEACAISLPAGKIDNLPVGLQLICAKAHDARLLSIAKRIEKTQW